MWTNILYTYFILILLIQKWIECQDGHAAKAWGEERSTREATRKSRWGASLDAVLIAHHCALRFVAHRSIAYFADFAGSETLELLWTSSKTPGFLFTKASLLAGVGSSLGMNWDRLDAASVIFHVDLWPPPIGLKPRCVHPAGFHLWPRVRMPTQAHIQHDIHCECCECNAAQCNVM